MFLVSEKNEEISSDQYRIDYNGRLYCINFAMVLTGGEGAGGGRRVCVSRRKRLVVAKFFFYFLFPRFFFFQVCIKKVKTITVGSTTKNDES